MKKASGERAWAAVALFVSSGSDVRMISNQGETRLSASLNGAGALCVGRDHLFCAAEGGAIWRLDTCTLLPQALYPGGPGVCGLLLSADETRLYALLADGDSVLLSDAKTGCPIVLNHCGSNPRQMVLTQNVLAAAGGESGCIHLYDAQNLQEIRTISMPGPVYGIAACGKNMHALCLTPSLSSLLLTCDGKSEKALALEGMPGRLLHTGDALLAATQGWLHILSADGARILRRIRAPGRACDMCLMQGKLLLCDPFTECVFSLGRGGVWRLVCRHALQIAKN